MDTAAALAAAAAFPDVQHRIVCPNARWNKEFLVQAMQNLGADVIFETLAPIYRKPGDAYMQRNDRLVDHADVLLAFPRTRQEHRRSGTWATIRRARKRGIEVRLYPLNEGVPA